MAWDPVWESIFKSHEWGKYPDESFIRFVARNFYAGNRTATKLLEIGCGPGANIWYMVREKFDVYGIDGSDTAIQRAGARLKAEGLAANLRVGDIGKLPWDKEMFDAVADNECLAHNSTKDLEGILAEVHRVLKPKGLFYSRTFSNEVYKGKTSQEVAKMEYSASSDGPFAGRGFFRLSDAQSIRAHYGKLFNILSLDQLNYTINNGTIKISEWVIVCQK